MRVVITGMGIYSCIGTSLSEVSSSLYQGKSGIVVQPERKLMGYRCSAYPRAQRYIGAQRAHIYGAGK